MGQVIAFPRQPRLRLAHVQEAVAEYVRQAERPKMVALQVWMETSEGYVPHEVQVPAR